MKNIPDSEDSERAHQKSAQDHKTCQYNDQKKKTSSVTIPEICQHYPNVSTWVWWEMKSLLFKYVLMFLILIHQSFSR